MQAEENNQQQARNGDDNFAFMRKTPVLEKLHRSQSGYKY